MIVSTKGRYALIIMIDLAKNAGDDYISLADIASRQGLSMKYIENIVAILVKGELVQSKRGKNGGYRLSRDVDSYSINEILKLTEGSLAPVECLKNNESGCSNAGSCITLPLWIGLDNMIEQYLSEIKLADLINGAVDKSGQPCLHV